MNKHPCFRDPETRTTLSLVDKIEVGRAYSSVTSSTCFTLENLRMYAADADTRRKLAEEGWRTAEAERTRIQEEREKEKQEAEEEKAQAVKERDDAEEKLRSLESTCKGKCLHVPALGSVASFPSEHTRMNGIICNW